MIRIGSIGFGGRGVLAKQAHRPDHGSVLTAVCDTNPAVLAQAREEYGEDLFTTSDYRRLLERDDVDAVFVTTPDFLHEEHAVAVLETGRGVYLEKPMAITIEGCDRILTTAAQHNARLYVGHNMRFFPVILKMKQLIDEGRIGQVQAIWCRHFISYGGDAYFKDWHSEQQYATGLLLQKGAHDIDVIHFLADSYTQRTVGMGKLSVYNQVQDRRGEDEVAPTTWNLGNWPPLSQKGLSPIIDVEDHTMILMNLRNGVQASYQQCHYTPDSTRNYTVIGTHGRIENIGDHSTRDHWAAVRLWDQRSSFLEGGTESFAIAPIEGSHGGADPMIVADFLEYLRTDERRGGATPLDARMSVATGCQATESLRHGNIPLDIPAPPDDLAPAPTPAAEPAAV